MLIVAIDAQLPPWLKEKGVACWARPDNVCFIVFLAPKPESETPSTFANAPSQLTLN
jgi:hypothetical protein